MERKITFGSVNEGTACKEFYEEIANDIERIINNAIEKRGKATLLLSGGSSPIPVYQILGKKDLDWPKIHFGLVDERFVPVNHEHSNEDMIRKMFNGEVNKDFQLLGMVEDAFDYKRNSERIEDYYSAFYESDLILLGMGLDGHTASIFPNERNSTMSYEMNTNTVLTQAPTFPYKRISTTPRLIHSAKNLFLLLNGKNKKEVFENSHLNLPIHKFIPYIHMTYIAL